MGDRRQDKISILDNDKKDQFLHALEQRYHSELNQIYKLNPKHKEWWLNDQGINREKLFFSTFKNIELITGSLYGKSALDMGCGSGASLVALNALGMEAVGVENESCGEDLELAKLRCSMYGFEPTLVKADALDIPFDKDTFDLVISSSVIEHIKNYHDYLKEVYRVLKNGGYAYISTNNRINPYDSHSDLYFYNWMPHRIFELAVNNKFKLPLDSKFTVWHVSYPRLVKDLKKIGFKINANWADFFMLRNENSSAFKHKVLKTMIKLKFPLSYIANSNTFVVHK